MNGPAPQSFLSGNHFLHFTFSHKLEVESPHGKPFLGERWHLMLLVPHDRPLSCRERGLRPPLGIVGDC